MADVSKHDWKLYSERLPKWQEAWMDRLNREYMEILSGDGIPSEKFWALEKRIREDKRHAGVIVRDARRSTMDLTIRELLHDGVITMEDLDGFSDEVREFARRCQER